MSPAGAQPPSASWAALKQCVNQGMRAGTHSLVMGWAETAHRATCCGPWEGEPPALISVPTLTPIPLPISVLPGSITGPTARWRSCNLLPVPRATCSLAEICSFCWSQDLD